MNDDRRFSRMIRNRDDWTCQLCGTRYAVGSGELHCAHMFGRWKPTRFDPVNACALCWECHGWIDTHPIYKREFFALLLGSDRFEALERRSNGVNA